MKDTTKATEELFTRMLLDLAPAERLAMACRMFSAAKALVLAGVSAAGSLSAAEARGLVFLRFYGRDFDQAKRAGVLSRLQAT